MAAPEILRALAALSEPPGAEGPRLAALLELGAPVDEAEWSELFLFQLTPYASVYLGAEGRIGGEVRDRIAGFWRALGLGPPDECDHLATMLAFHAELVEHAAAAADADERRRWTHVRRAFLWEHLLSWLPAYQARLECVAPPFFRAWSRLLGRALGAETRALPEPAEPSLHWRSAPSLVDPRRAGGGAFLDSLLTPAASGLILTRADLVRAAGELGLAPRVGERRFLLATLLAQDAPAVLAWLAREAEDWRRRLSSRRAEEPAPGEFWRERAGATAGLLAELAGEAG